MLPSNRSGKRELRRKTPIQSVIKQPIIAVVEAKRGELPLGYGQCAAEMVAARLFNKSKETVYGIVTSGIVWQFLMLKENELFLDLNEYTELDRVLGILFRMVQ